MKPSTRVAEVRKMTISDPESVDTCKRGRGRPPETTPEELRSIALELFAAHGYDATSLTMIARAAGISRTTLFAYFPTKRDIIWGKHDERRRQLHLFLNSRTTESIADTIVGALLTLSRYSTAEHEIFTLSYRVAAASPELRAYSSLNTADMADEIIAWAQSHHPQLNPDLIGYVTYALLAVCMRVIDQWVLTPDPETDLACYVAQQLSPLVDALSPLLNS